jgi:hypothetical protein
MSLKLGAWKMNENGVEGTLLFQTVDPDTGAVSGGIEGFGALKGLWDETSRTINFVAFTEAVSSPRFYKGFLFSTPRNPAPGQDVVWTLAGFVQLIDLGNVVSMGGNARRTVFGWFAQITEVG